MQHDCIAAVLYFMRRHHTVSAQLLLWVCTPGTATSILSAPSKTPSRHSGSYVSTDAAPSASTLDRASASTSAPLLAPISAAWRAPHSMASAIVGVLSVTRSTSLDPSWHPQHPVYGGRSTFRFSILPIISTPWHLQHLGGMSAQHPSQHPLAPRASGCQWVLAYCYYRCSDSSHSVTQA
jgi:hypothetical protein